jgi:hypothetical protein
MLACSFDIKGIIQYKFVPPEQSPVPSTFNVQNAYGSAFIKK